MPLSRPGVWPPPTPFCAAALAQARDVGALRSRARLQAEMVISDLEANRLQDADVHLQESLQLHARTGSWLDLCEDLDHCGLLCAATGRHAEAATVWAAMISGSASSASWSGPTPRTGELRRGETIPWR